MRARRKEPVRTCVGCRGTAEKRELIRLVRGSGGKPAIDPTGKAPGRGAYLHRDRSCWQAAVQRGSLARAFGTGLTPEEASTLLEAIEGASTK